MEKNKNFRAYLEREFLRRSKNNPKYTLRAFARQVNISHSSLSQILSGKRTLTDKTCERLADQLELSPQQRAKIKSGKPQKKDNTKMIAEDAFAVISDWHHYAILELTHLSCFKPDLKWISTTLEISLAETRDAVARLVRLNYLKIEKNDWIDQLGKAGNQGLKVPGGAYKKLQRQVLEKGIDALDSIPFNERSQTSMTLVGSRKKVAHAKDKIIEFMDELNAYMRSGNDSDEVYHLGVSLYPVSQNNRSKK